MFGWQGMAWKPLYQETKRAKTNFDVSSSILMFANTAFAKIDVALEALRTTVF